MAASKPTGESYHNYESYFHFLTYLELFPKDGVISHLIIELRSYNLIV